MAELTEAHIKEITDTLQRGDKIGAIKLYRSYVGVDLKTAKEAVEAIQRQPNAHGLIPGSAPDATAAFSEDEAHDLTEAILAGRKIDAIKLYRARSGIGLKESKTVIDELERQLWAECPERFTRPPSKLGCGVVMIIGGSLGLMGWMIS